MKINNRLAGYIARTATIGTLAAYTLTGCGGSEPPGPAYEGPVSNGHATLDIYPSGSEMLRFKRDGSNNILRMQNNPVKPAYGDSLDGIWAFNMETDATGKATRSRLEFSREFVTGKTVIQLRDTNTGKIERLSGTAQDEWDGRILQQMKALEPQWEAVRGEIADSLDARVRRSTE
jgi:hypothetical protein